MKTKKTRISPQKNTRARRMFILFVSLLYWMILLSTIRVAQLLFLKEEVDIQFSIEILLVFILMSLGIFGVISKRRPFHYFLLLGVLLNTLISFPRPQSEITSYLIHFPLSIVVLYLGIRFPLIQET